jgi:phosphoribosylamine---glycine ligase
VKVLVVGNGGREHALAWALLQSDTVHEVFCVPGNGGTAQLAGCRNIAMSVVDFEGIARLSLVNNVGLVVVGPEIPLAQGIADYLQNEGIKVFGPTQVGAQIESSKAWAKALMETAQIPTAAYQVFRDAKPAIAFLETADIPIVIKADGLAAGKGVTVATTKAEAIAAVAAAFEGKFGQAGDQVVIEDCLAGQEASVLAITDGISVRPLLPAQDHKCIGEGDTGPNTGGMGAYAPTPIISEAMMDRIQREILEPAIAALREQGIDYRGVLYAGLMITPQGNPKVIEFNCRFGDPETQAILPLLETPLDKVLLSCVEQRLSQLPPLDWKPGFATCVVAAADGYPNSYTKGHPITGLQAAQETEAMVFHAGTKLSQGRLLTDGGRVLGVTAIGDTLQASIAQTYEAIAQIQFEGMYIRSDIGHRILNQS